ncbi:hypothetical protein, conserved [Eimeria praecox]|uniref:Uncharacterized protein n=1 Tax=Eimeria praecox TaxID=51316 RepID=U6GQ10_9EIME|nr:hypothetical protein, conserved [Eimeria praecox]
MDWRGVKRTPVEEASSLAEDDSSYRRGAATEKPPASDSANEQQKTEAFAASSELKETEADSTSPSSSSFTERPHQRYFPANNPWLLQAAEMVFASSSVSPDVLTEEPIGERRPLLLAALAEAIEVERAVQQAAEDLKLVEVNEAIYDCQKTLQNKLDEAFDLVRLLLARGASVSVPSEKGVFPLEYAIKKHSLRVSIVIRLAASRAPHLC